MAYANPTLDVSDEVTEEFPNEIDDQGKNLSAFPNTLLKRTYWI